MVISCYFLSVIGGYLWLLVFIPLMVIDVYYINGY